MSADAVQVQDAPNPGGARSSASRLVWSHIVWSRNEMNSSQDRCVAVGSVTNGAPLILQQCEWTPGRNMTRYFNQLWSLPTAGKDLRIGAGGSSSVPYCVAVDGTTSPVLRACANDTDAQRWFVNRYSQISPLGSLGSCLDLNLQRGTAAMPAEGTRLVLATCYKASVVDPRNTSQYFPETRESIRCVLCALASILETFRLRQGRRRRSRAHGVATFSLTPRVGVVLQARPSST